MESIEAARYVTEHEKLFSGSSLKLGKVHYLILHAATKMEKESYIDIQVGGVERTEFAKEIGSDEIHWYVFRRENKIEELLRRTENTLKVAQKLKDDSFELRDKFYSDSYPELIQKIKEFEDQHDAEIQSLYDYVLWLHQKDALAPIILFTYRVWGSTRRGDRWIDILTNDIDRDLHTLKKCIEYVFGLRNNHAFEPYTIERVFSEIWGEIADSIDPEYGGSITVPAQRLFIQTSHRVLSELAAYFELIRDSLRQIISEIEEFKRDARLLYNESFWRNFILHTIKIPTESQLYDFKKTLSMWHAAGQEKDRYEIEFCEDVASFANVEGGALIIGITDESPRKVVGFGEFKDMENRMKYIRDVTRKYIDYDRNFIHMQVISIKYEENTEKYCLLVAVAQTEKEVRVRDNTGKFSCPVRAETGLRREDPDTVRMQKVSLFHDNYDFLTKLQDMCQSTT